MEFEVSLPVPVGTGYRFYQCIHMSSNLRVCEPLNGVRYNHVAYGELAYLHSAFCGIPISSRFDGMRLGAKIITALPVKTISY